VNTKSLGNALSTAGKVVLGAVLHAGDALRASISGESETPPNKPPGKKRRRMKRKKSFRPPPEGSSPDAYPSRA
jgi:hypothetical protein